MNRGVYRIPLGIAAHHGVAGIDVGEHTTASEFGCNKAFFLSIGYHFLHIFGDSRICLAIAVEQHIGFAARNSETLGKSECRNAVKDAEIGSFGVSAHVGSNLIEGHMIDFCRGGAVDILSA